MQIGSITPRACVITVTTNTAELKNLGTVPMISSMPTECVRTVTSIHTTGKEGNKRTRIELKILII